MQKIPVIDRKKPEKTGKLKGAGSKGRRRRKPDLFDENIPSSGSGGASAEPKPPEPGTSSSGLSKVGNVEDIQMIVSDLQSEEDVEPRVRIVTDLQSEECLDPRPLTRPESTKYGETGIELGGAGEPAAGGPSKDASVGAYIGGRIEQEGATASYEVGGADRPPQADDCGMKNAKSCFYELSIIALSIMVVFAGMSVFYVLLFLNDKHEAPRVVEFKSDASPQKRPPSAAAATSTSTTSSTAEPPQATTLPLIVCERPYIRFGLGCCIDRDGNSVCDGDESSESTTTLGDYIVCSGDSDCGLTRVEYDCRDGDVHRLTFAHFCMRPGLRGSSCQLGVVDQLWEACGPVEHCSKGRDKCQKSQTDYGLIG
jgi:hypothetical protein